jgi:hypothetical protein
VWILFPIERLFTGGTGFSYLGRALLWMFMSAMLIYIGLAVKRGI